MTENRKSHRPASPSPPSRPSARRATAERKLRILERLKTGASVADIAHMEAITVRRVRQIIAEALDEREVDPPAGFVQLQIARLGDAMLAAYTKMMDGDLQAMDRVIRLTGELDRYHGFSRSEIGAALPPAPPPRIPAPKRELALAKLEDEKGEAEIFSALEL